MEKNLSRRESSERYIEHNMKEAAGWDPTKASYETYSHRWHWGWGWTQTRESKQLTDESQKKWRTRTDACMYYLSRVAKGLNTVKRLDAEAVKLGLEPTYKPGEIDLLLKDIKVRFASLRAHRNKKTE